MTAPFFTEIPLGRNLAALGSRLTRQHPLPAAADRMRVRVGLIFLVLLGLALAGMALARLDGVSVPWATGLPGWLVGFFGFLSGFGRSAWELIPTGILVIVLMLGDWRRPRRLVAAAWTEIGVLTAYLFVAIAASGIAINVIKWIVGRSRPGLFDTDGVLTLSPIAFGYANNGFPSGHATTVGALTVALWLISRRAGIVAFVFALLIGISRVVLRAHFPSDVVAGLLIGGGLAWWLAFRLSVAGVGFRYTRDRRIVPRVAAVRGVLRRPHALTEMRDGLVEALAGGFSGFWGPDEEEVSPSQRAKSPPRDRR